MKLTSNEPFWLVKNGLIASYPSLAEDIRTDVLVVGSGITGSLIAHQCVKDGYQTVLVDKREIANGSSSATTSMLQYEVDTPLWELIEMIGEEGAVASYRACYDSIDTLGRLARKVKSGCGFKKKNSLLYAKYKKDVPDLQKEHETRLKHGFRGEWLEADEIRERYDLTGSHGGILTFQGGSIDAFRLAHDLLYYNLKKGLDVFDKTEITEVKYGRKGIVATTQYGNTIRAGKIIYCNGFESTQIIPEKFVDLLSSYAIVSEPFLEKPDKISETLIWDTGDPYIYMRTTDDHRILIGGEDDEFQDPQKRDQSITQKKKRLEQIFEKLFPGIRFRTDFAWAGTFGETKDGLPYIGEHPDFPGAYFVLGMGGNGITFSVTGMEMVSDFLKGKEHPLSEWWRFGR
ncbi:MAG: FAD-binding oxidoreductase [Leadbetterella sp.]|nr:FAD-binding oxidoreductase [Leadbetterella sp.]